MLFSGHPPLGNPFCSTQRPVTPQQKGWVSGGARHRLNTPASGTFDEAALDPSLAAEGSTDATPSRSGKPLPGPSSQLFPGSSARSASHGAASARAQASGQETRLPSSAWPRPSREAAAPCPRCRGTGFVPGPQGPVPCTACQPRRQATRASAPPEAPQDSILRPARSVLRRIPAATQRAIRRAQQQTQQAQQASRGPAPGGLPQPRGSPPASPQPAGSTWQGGTTASEAVRAAERTAERTAARGTVDGTAGGTAATEKRRVVMTEERREAIRRGALRKGSHSEEHKRKIAWAMREAHARNPFLRLVNTGKPKTCSYCGQVGHNKRGCPLYKAKQAQQPAAAAGKESSGTAGGGPPLKEPKRKPGPDKLPEERKRQLSAALRQVHALNPQLRYAAKGKPKMCKYCGEQGHTSRGCPQRRADEVAAARLAAGGVVSRVERQRRPPTCSHCGEEGHTRRWCPELRRQQSLQQTQRAAAAGVPTPHTGVMASGAAAVEGAGPLIREGLLLQRSKGSTLEGVGPPGGAPLTPLPGASSVSVAGGGRRVPIPGQEGPEPEGGDAPPAAPAIESEGGGVQGRRGEGVPGSNVTTPDASGTLVGGVREGGASEGVPPAEPAHATGAQQAQHDAGEGVSPSEPPPAKEGVGGGPRGDGDGGQQGGGGVTDADVAPAVADQVSEVASGRVGPEAGEAAPPLESCTSEEAVVADAEGTPAAAQPPPSLPTPEQTPQPPSQPSQQQEPTEGMPMGGAVSGSDAAALARAERAARGIIYRGAGLATRELGSSGMLVDPDGGLVMPLPRRQADCIAQASQAVLRAWEDGVRWQCLELPLPLNNAPAEGGWPGGIRQQYRVVLPILEGLLLNLKRLEGLEGRITAEWLDKSDCVGAWQSEKLAAVLFPTADTLPAVQRIDNALSGQRLMLVVNPQWQVEGQVISDFGFGQARRRAEQFVRIFQEVYCLRRARIRGEEVRILKCYPGSWQVYYVQQDGKEPLLLACEDTRPGYQRLEELMQPILARKESWVQQWLRWASSPSSPPPSPSGGGTAQGDPPPRQGSPGGEAPYDPDSWWLEEDGGTAGAGAATPPASSAERAQQQQLEEGGGIYGGAAWASRRDREAVRVGPYRPRVADTRYSGYPDQQNGEEGLDPGDPSPAVGSVPEERAPADVAGGTTEERDVITGEVVRDYPLPGDEGAQARDYRMQPVQQMAKWVFGSGAEEGGGRSGRKKARSPPPP